MQPIRLVTFLLLAVTFILAVPTPLEGRAVAQALQSAMAEITESKMGLMGSQDALRTIWTAAENGDKTAVKFVKGLVSQQQFSPSERVYPVAHDIFSRLSSSVEYAGSDVVKSASKFSLKGALSGIRNKFTGLFGN